MLKFKTNQLLILLLLFTFQSIHLEGQTEIKINGIVFPSFTTSQRDQISAEEGQCIYNRTTNFIECYNGFQWRTSSDDDEHPWLVGPFASQTVYLPIDKRVGLGTSAAAASLQIDSPADVDPFRARIGMSTKLRVHTNGSVSVGSSSVGTENGLYVSGNAGIGTSTPDAKMVIDDNNWQFKLNNNNTGGGNWYIGSSANDWNSGGGKFILSRTNSSASPSLVVNDIGNVGISMKSPSTKLHVNGGSDVNSVSGGYITVGADNSSHIAIDNNEIMARNNGTVAPLTLNAEGGEVRINAAGSRDSDALDIVGRVYFDNGGKSGMRITADNSNPSNAVFEPTSFERGFLGTVALPFSKVYSREFFARGTSDYRTYSDRRLKGNILPIKSALDKIKDLEGVSYALIESPLRTRIHPLTDQEKYLEDNQLGFIAQDVAKVFPQLVTTDETSGLLTVAYMGVIPVLVEAIKEQQLEIEILEKQVKDLARKAEIYAEKNANLEGRMKNIEVLLSDLNSKTLSSSN